MSTSYLKGPFFGNSPYRRDPVFFPPVFFPRLLRDDPALSALPGADKVLKSPVVAKTLQSAYHRLNTKARKYEPLSPQERLKWEAYYAPDQKELSDLLQGLQVIE